MAMSPATAPQSAGPNSNKTLVVGGGPVGFRVAQDLAARGHAVTLLSAETVDPYNRVRLTPLLSGDVQFSEISLGAASAGDLPFELHLGQRAKRIARDDKHVITADGSLWRYDTLILATGSRAHVPSIPGIATPGVFTFRTADDAAALVARSFSARKVVVIGGGLLGLEAARGMRARSCAVTVVEHEGTLMPRQLDQAGGARLAQTIADLGVDVRTSTAVKAIEGDHRVTGVTLATGEQLDCDTVVVCTGVRANIALAQDARLAFGRGITTNDRMQTSDPAIFAVGECAEHRGQLYGLVGPGYLQAQVAAAAIAGEAATFDGAVPATKLKVIGADVFSVGEIDQLEARATVKSHTWEDAAGYRRVFLERGKLVGAVAVGAWDQASRVQDAVADGATVYPWMLFRFRKGGDLWPEADLSPSEMPDRATLCNCTGVTCGQIRGAMAKGCTSAQAVSDQTGAGSVCGTCKPLLAELVDANAAPEPIALWKPVLGLSGLAVCGAAYPLVAGHIPLPQSYDADSLRTWLWQDNIVKQWSGFTLLGLTLAGFAIGLRKRLRFMDRLGSFDGWRLVHNGIGLAALLALLAHTGFNLGHGWNLALGLTFVATIAIGALAGLATGGDHELRARRIGSAKNPPRKLPTWIHILVVWPLPVLILGHVLASYAF